MDILEHINSAVQYIESNLCGEIDMNKAAGLALTSADGFSRVFSFITGMTVNEYIRKRRLSIAAEDLRNGDRVIDIALKYGYDSGDSFTKAFVKQHGITPTQARVPQSSINVYPPIRFLITVKGAKKMNFSIIEVEETEVFGLSMAYDKTEYGTREELRHYMWAEQCGDIPKSICGGSWDQSADKAYDGIWYGIWQDGRYAIAREKELAKGDKLQRWVIKAGKYARFETDKGAYAAEEIPALFELIFDSWLPSSGYRLRNEDIIEVYHLWTEKELRKKNRYYEVWVPIEK